MAYICVKTVLERICKGLEIEVVQLLLPYSFSYELKLMAKRSHLYIWIRNLRLYDGQYPLNGTERVHHARGIAADWTKWAEPQCKSSPEAMQLSPFLKVWPIHCHFRCVWMVWILGVWRRRSIKSRRWTSGWRGVNNHRFLISGDGWSFALGR